MGGGGPTTTYTVSSAASIAENSFVWVIIEPVPIGTWTATSNSQYLLKVYLQTAAPTPTDTPVVSETISQGVLDQIRVFRRATAAGVIDELKVECIPLATMNTETTWSKKTPVPWVGTGFGSVLSVIPTPTTSKMAQAYLGTDNVYTKKEDS